MGRPKKHPDIRRIEGNPGKRAIDELLIVVEGEAIAPNHLSDDATLAFEMIKGALPPGLLATVDTFLLSAFATSWSIHKEATLLLQGQALVLTAPNGRQYANPLLHIMACQAQIMLSLGSKLGLNPVSRIGLSASEPQQRSKFNGLTGRDVEGVWRRH